MKRLAICILFLLGGSCSESIEPASTPQKAQKKSSRQATDGDSLDADANQDEDAAHDHSDTLQGTSTATRTGTSTRTTTSTSTNTNTSTTTSSGTSSSPASDVVEFRIREGTGRNPWNTRDTVVTVKVGQTLKIINEDSMVHRLHTGGAPCPHQPGPGIQKGEEFLCKIERTLNVGNGAPATYDHNVGPSAAFFLRAVN